MKIEEILAYAVGYETVKRTLRPTRLIARYRKDAEAPISHANLKHARLCGALDAVAGRAGADEAIFEVTS